MFLSSHLSSLPKDHPTWARVQEALPRFAGIIVNQFKTPRGTVVEEYQDYTKRMIDAMKTGFLASLRAIGIAAPDSLANNVAGLENMEALGPLSTRMHTAPQNLTDEQLVDPVLIKLREEVFGEVRVSARYMTSALCRRLSSFTTSS